MGFVLQGCSKKLVIGVKSIGTKDFTKVRSGFRAGGDDPLDGETVQKREGIILGAVSGRRREWVGCSKQTHLPLHRAFMLRRVRASLRLSADLSGKRSGVLFFVPVCVYSCRPILSHIGETEAAQ